MGLENAQFIPELVSTNPLGVDAVNLGDNHLRVIKTAVQGSFPAFVGTTAVPRQVDLTEDEINVLIDAAIKNIAQTITGDWTFQGLSNFEALATFEAQADFEDGAGNTVFSTTTRALGSAIVRDRLGSTRRVGFRNPTRFPVAAADALIQDYEGQTAEYTGAAGAITVNSLLQDTAITLINKGAGDIALTAGSATINWLDGSGAAVGGNRTIAANSVIQLYWGTTTTVDIWGNGTS